VIKPPKLNAGDAIGFFSPSSPATWFAPKRYQRAKKYLENHGFDLVPGSLTGKQDYYRSGSIRERVDELNALIRNKKIRCIMSTIGGMNSSSLLPYIDYEALKKDPKIIIGYSDVTALLLGILNKTDLVTYYGPALVASYGEFEPLVSMSFRYFHDLILEEPENSHVLPMPESWTDEKLDWETQNRAKRVTRNKWITVNTGIAEGRLIGGNLNTITSIWGSPYMPAIKDGDILFIEDSMKDAAMVERLFSHLNVNQVFDKVSGIILGKHELYDDKKTGRKPVDILLEVLNGRPVPVLAEFDCCHTHPMLTMPLGCQFRLDTGNQQITLLESCVQGDELNA